MKNLILWFTVTFFTISNSIAQWTKINAVPSQSIAALAAYNDTIFAASRTNLLYRSTDAGINWNTITVSNSPIVIITLKVIDNIIYIGTASHGTFSSTDNGVTWVKSANNLLAVPGIAKKGNDIYAATLGDGVFIYNQNNNSWLPFNNSLPSYSVNVFTILSTPASLLIGAGANGTFYRYNFTTNAWDEEFYYGLLVPGLLIDKLVNNTDTIFAVNGNSVIRSENNGLNWTDDKTGTHDGYARNLFTGAINHYLITNIPLGGTWVQQRNKHSITGASWETNEELLPTGFAYDILEFKNKLFLAKADGLYIKDVVLAVDNPARSNTTMEIFPNPSNGAGINVISDKQVNKLNIFNALGQLNYSSTAGKSKFIINPHLSPGVYFMNLKLSNGQSMVRKIIIE
ncbi:MAG: T9SS type A sorting domain-containing protein [Sphingobacteriales bacterium]